MPGSVIRTAWLHDGKYGIHCPFCLSWSEIERGQLGETISCPACQSQPKINSFIVEAEWHPSPRRTHLEKVEHVDIELSPAMSEFADFIRGQVHILHEHPELTFQQAMNQPDSSSVFSAAQALLGHGVIQRPWLRWVNKPQSHSSCLMDLGGHTSFVHTCSFSPDGARIVSGSRDKTLKIWDAQTGQEIYTLIGHTDVVETCSFSPDGSRIVSGSWDGILKIWDTETREEIAVFFAKGSIWNSRKVCEKKFLQWSMTVSYN